MRELYYDDGRIAGCTMTVSELIEKLREYPADMPVFGTWEGVHGPIIPQEFAIERFSKSDAEPCLVIDVENYTCAEWMKKPEPPK